MTQLLVICHVAAAAVGLYRCNHAESTTASPDNLRDSRLEETLQPPRDMERAIRDQMDAINERNQQILQRY